MPLGAGGGDASSSTPPRPRDAPAVAVPAQPPMPALPPTQYPAAPPPRQHSGSHSPGDGGGKDASRRGRRERNDSERERVRELPPPSPGSQQQQDSRKRRYDSREDPPPRSVSPPRPPGGAGSVLLLPAPGEIDAWQRARSARDRESRRADRRSRQGARPRGGPPAKRARTADHSDGPAPPSSREASSAADTPPAGDTHRPQVSHVSIREREQILQRRRREHLRRIGMLDTAGRLVDGPGGPEEGRGKHRGGRVEGDTFGAAQLTEVGELKRGSRGMQWDALCGLVEHAVASLQAARGAHTTSLNNIARIEEDCKQRLNTERQRRMVAEVEAERAQAAHAAQLKQLQEDLEVERRRRREAEEALAKQQKQLQRAAKQAATEAPRRDADGSAKKARIAVT